MSKMRISLVSTVIGHGRVLQDSGTGLAILLSEIQHVESINLVTWVRDSNEYINWPKKITLYPIFSRKSPFSVFKIFKILLSLHSDLIVFNLMPTAYENSNIANSIGLLLPLLIKIFTKQKVIDIYHNSIYTNDFQRLGYTGKVNHLKSKIIMAFETLLFKSIDTYMLSSHYEKKINLVIKKSKVKSLTLPFFQVIGTLLLTEAIGKEKITVNKNRIPHILIFGSWGPQKNPEPLLKALRIIREHKHQFFLTVAGGVNPHFKNSLNEFDTLFSKYREVIDRRTSYVHEADLIGLFTSADLILINYNAPGGFSSVLSQGVFFEKFIIMSDFPEYREQANGYSKIRFCDERDFESNIREYIEQVHPTISGYDIIIREKIANMERVLDDLINFNYKS